MIQVNEMRITVPGMNEYEAGELGRRVAEQMAAGMGDHQHITATQINELNLDFRATQGMKPSEMADIIAAKLLQQLRML